MKSGMNNVKKSVLLIVVAALGFTAVSAQGRPHNNGNRGNGNRGNQSAPQTRPSNNGNFNRGNNRPAMVHHSPMIRNNNRTVNRTVVRNTTVINRQPSVRRTTVINSPSRGYRPAGWAPTRRAYTRPPVVYNNRRYYSYHNYYAHPYKPYYYGSSWHPRGFFLSAFVNPFITINVGSRPYWYSEGVFYEPYNNGYQAVYAPYGAYVPSLPAGFQQVMVAGQNYYYYGGAFFVQNGGNYQVVQAPAGAIVYNLPDGASTVQIGDYSYIEYNDTYYEPIQINGADAYEVVELEDGQ